MRKGRADVVSVHGAGGRGPGIQNKFCFNLGKGPYHETLSLNSLIAKGGKT